AGGPVRDLDQEQSGHHRAHHHERPPDAAVEQVGAEPWRPLIRAGEFVHHLSVGTRWSLPRQITPAGSPPPGVSAHRAAAAARRCAAVSPFAATGTCPAAAASPNRGMLAYRVSHCPPRTT